MPVYADDAHHTKAEAQQRYGTKGVVVSIDRSGAKLKLKHEAVSELKWPGMTMDFAVADKAMLNGLQAGERVEFQFEMAAGAPRITGITPVK
ncbi:MAG TPA: copper-binding protein [Novimethylophilus sp.]|uniref:copper-binding protein n=1 Tax=Novimethylophilus sp. TaxID=2137426 RepID=UPI002F41B036